MRRKSNKKISKDQDVINKMLEALEKADREDYNNYLQKLAPEDRLELKQRKDAEEFKRQYIKRQEADSKLEYAVKEAVFYTIFILLIFVILPLIAVAVL